MSLAMVTAPVGEVLTLQEVREHLRIDHAHDDVYLLGLIRAATGHVEGRYGSTERAFLTQTWDEFFHCFPYRSTDSLRLTLRPVLQITSVKYLDPAHAEQTWSSSDYETDLKSIDAWIRPAPGKSYPATSEKFNAVTVRYVAGYGTPSYGSRVQVPQEIRHALLGLIGHWYEHREAVTTDEAMPVPAFVEALLSPYIPLRVAV